MSARSVFEIGPFQVRSVLEMFGGPPEEDRSEEADQQRVGILSRMMSLLVGGPSLPVPIVRRRGEDVDAAELPAGAPPVLPSLRPAGDVDLSAVELDVEGEIGER